MVAEEQEEPTTASSEGARASGGEEGFVDWLREPARIALIVVAAVGGLVTFVAAVGGAVVWVRFYMAELPAEEALAVLPRGQLVASGGITLAAFVLLGVVAVVGVYLFEDRLLHEGYKQRGVIRGLLTLATVEGVVVVALAMGVDRGRRFVAAEAVVLFAMLILLVIRAREAILREKPHDAQLGPETKEQWEAREREEKKRRIATLADVLIGVASLTAVVLAAGLEIDAIGRDASADRGTQTVVLGVALAVVAAALYVRWILYGFDEPTLKDPDSPLPKGDARKRRFGKFLVQLLALLAIAFAWLIVQQDWIAVTLAAVMLAGLVCWRTAKRAKYEFRPYVAVALFVSVPVLGAVAGITRNFCEPQVQPMALIRKGDSPSQALQGIYVAETDDRVYFASVATRKCGGDIDQNSGRLLWVPRRDVVAMSLGPPQNVEDAGERALEMHYALAPEAAIAFGPEESGASPVRGARRRLEDPGSAVRRDFDLDELSPGSVRAGESVEVAADSDETERTLRLDGVPVARFEGDSVPRFTVPHGARSGPVSVECDGSPAEPVLRVRRDPRARVWLRLDAGSDQLAIDGRLSTDQPDGRITSWSWQVEGHDGGHARRLIRSVSPRHGLYEISLRVSDDEGDNDRVAAWMWRLAEDELPLDPAILSSEDRIAFSAALRELANGGRLVVYGYPGVHGGLRAAQALVDGVIRAIENGGDGDEEIRSTVLGESCPADRRSGTPQAGARVDVFVLARDARVLLPPGCTP
jgi:hypothetical protein